MIDVKAIHYDENIYPRKQHNNKTVDDYAEALLSGAKFPEIELQQVQYNGEIKNVLVDGWHRWQAYLKVSKQGDLFADADNFKEIGFQYWKPDEVIDSDNTVEMLRLKLRGAEVNSHHGDRLKADEMKALAREIAERCPKEGITQEEISQALGRERRRVGEWIADIRARQTAGRDSLINKLNLLGWTQQEIGDVVGLSQQQTSRITQNTDFGKMSNEIQTFLEQGQSMA